MTNWRLIEAELVDKLVLQGVYLEDSFGDSIIFDMNGDALVNITELAKALADSLSLTARPVQVKAAAECEQTVEVRS